MRIFYTILSILWGLHFVALFFGYNPDKFMIGTAFFIVTIIFISETIERGVNNK